MLVRSVGINAMEHKNYFHLNDVTIVARMACVVGSHLTSIHGQEMNVMDHLVELVDTNVFQNQVNLSDPYSHSCKSNESFFGTPNC